LSVVARHIVRRETAEPDVTDRRIAFGIGSIANVLAQIAGIDLETINEAFGRAVTERPRRIEAALGAKGGGKC
jgi:hypothetical protein